VGKAGGYYATLKLMKQEEEEKQWREGLDKREKTILHLQKVYNESDT
jgi:hypothetical protein